MTITINWAKIKPYVMSLTVSLVGYVIANPQVIPAQYRDIAVAVAMFIAAHFVNRNVKQA